MEILPRKELIARVGGLFVARTADFETAAVETVTVGYEGLAGDLHAGLVRASTSREPWYPRGTELRNERQITILSTADLQATADAIGVPEIAPEWIGGNMVLDGIENLSMLPASTLLFFAGGVTMKIDSQNEPCRIAGRRIAQRNRDRNEAELALAFVAAAKRRRGLIAWVEKTGTISTGEQVRVQLPEQWLYR